MMVSISNVQKLLDGLAWSQRFQGAVLVGMYITNVQGSLGVCVEERVSTQEGQH